MPPGQISPSLPTNLLDSDLSPLLGHLQTFGCLLLQLRFIPAVEPCVTEKGSIKEP